MRKLTTLALLALVVACGDAPTDPLSPPDGSGLISDANQNQGNKAFFWLAPVVKNNLYAGVFNPQLKPLVSICELDLATNACKPGVQPLAQWSMSSGLTLSVTGHHYGFEWHTDQTATNYQATYRIQVFLTEAADDLLGYADVQFFSNGQQLRNIETGEYIELRDGRTLPGRFRIEKGVSCNGETDCGEGSVGPEGGTVTTESGFAGVFVPAGAADGPILIKIRRVVDPTQQPWGDCLPTGLRQEEGCYEYDTEPAIGEVNQQDAFNTDVVVGICIDPAATRPERLLLHKFDPERPEDGVTELRPSPENFLTCDGFAYDGDTDLFQRFARAAGRLFSPVARLVGATPLYATDAGRAGLTNAFSFFGYAEPLDLSLLSAPELLVPGSPVPATIGARTRHNHGDPALPASGHVLRLEYTDPAETPVVAVLDPLATDGAGEAQPAWTLTSAVGIHTLAVSTRKEILVNGAPFLVPDPTGVLTVSVGGYTVADDCPAGSDCVVAVVGPAGDTIVTSTGFAGVGVPAGAVKNPVAIKIRRVADPAQQPWGRCLPTGLRQVEGCYEYDTEPALAAVNEGVDAFLADVVVAICIAPDPRRQYLTLHKFDPERPQQGVVELAGATEDFLTCDGFAALPNGFFGRMAAAGRRVLAPVTAALAPRPLYATDAGRAGLTNAFSFIGWAESVTLALTTQPDATTVGITDVVVTATTAHNGPPLHPATAADGAIIRFEYTDPSLATAIIEETTDANGQARISLTAQAGTHNVKVSTQQEILIDSDLLVAGAGGVPGIFAAPTLTFIGVPTAFLVPDPTPVVSSEPVTILGLVSRWDADDAAAPFADRVGPNDGSAAGFVDATAPGVDGTAFLFDGNGGTVVAPAENIGAAARFTVAAWVKLDPAGDPLAIQRFVTIDDAGNPKAVLRQEAAEVAEARKLHLYSAFEGTADLTHIREPNALIAGCWHHVAGTYDGKYLNLYRDGVLVGEAGIGQLSSVTAARVVLGWGAEPLTGTLDEVEVHNYALSASEIQALASRFASECTITSGSVSGQVTDATSSLGLAGATVAIVGTTLAAITDAAGAYRLSNVPAGTYTLRTSLGGYQAAEQVVTVTAGRVTGADVALTPTPPLSQLTLPFVADYPEDVVGPEFDVTASSPNISISALNGSLIISSTAPERFAIGQALVPSASSYMPLTATTTQPLAIRTELWSATSLGGSGIADSYARLVLQGPDKTLTFGMKGPSTGPEGVHYQVTEGGATTETFLGPYDVWNHVYMIVYDGAHADLYYDGNLLAGDVPFTLAEFRVALNATTPYCCTGSVNATFGGPVIRNAALSVQLTQTSVSLAVGESVDVDASGRDASGASVGWATLIWSSSNPGVATVDAAGVITAVAAGTATITARVDGASADVAVTVSQPLSAHEVTAGNLHTCALSGGEAFCWGNNASGQLGNGTSTDAALPVRVLKPDGVYFGGPITAWGDVSDGVNDRAHTCVRTSAAPNPVIYCWGENGFGEVGDGSTTNRLTPVLVSENLTGPVTAGARHTCTSQPDYCWGLNASGQLGNGTTTSSSVPAAFGRGDSNFARQISAGEQHTCATVITEEGLVCWGANNYGQLGIGTTGEPSLVPVAVAGPPVGELDAGEFHTCGIDRGGVMYCWGRNDAGQIGDGTTVASRAAPTRVADPASGPVVWRKVSAGALHTCGLTDAGALYCWGANSSGQLGTGTIASSPVPQRVGGALNWGSVSAGGEHTCGVTTTQLVYCWGGNHKGQLGNGTTETRTTPTAVIRPVS